MLGVPSVAPAADLCCGEYTRISLSQLQARRCPVADQSSASTRPAFGSKQHTIARSPSPSRAERICTWFWQPRASRGTPSSPAVAATGTHQGPNRLVGGPNVPWISAASASRAAALHDSFSTSVNSPSTTASERRLAVASSSLSAVCNANKKNLQNKRMTGT
jgi:hypothetical protein